MHLFRRHSADLSYAIRNSRFLIFSECVFVTIRLMNVLNFLHRNGEKMTIQIAVQYWFIIIFRVCVFTVYVMKKKCTGQCPKLTNSRKKTLWIESRIIMELWIVWRLFDVGMSRFFSSGIKSSFSLKIKCEMILLSLLNLAQHTFFRWQCVSLARNWWCFVKIKSLPKTYTSMSWIFRAMRQQIAKCHFNFNWKAIIA